MQDKNKKIINKMTIIPAYQVILQLISMFIYIRQETENSSLKPLLLGLFLSEIAFSLYTLYL